MSTKTTTKEKRRYTTSSAGAGSSRSRPKKEPEPTTAPTPGTRKVKLGEIVSPTPAAVREQFPDTGNVATLQESIRETGAWGEGRFLVREVEDGRVEAHFGGDLLRAMLLEYGEDHEVTVTVENVEDEALLRRRELENEVRKRPSALLDQETVYQRVYLMGEGIISVPPPDPRTPKQNIRQAPGFIQGAEPAGPARQVPYTASTLAEAMGWEETRTQNTLAALELREKGVLRNEHYAELPAKEARIVTSQVRKILAAGEERAKDLEAEAEGAEGDDAEKLRAQADRVRHRAAGQAGDVAARIRINLRSGKWARNDEDVEEKLKTTRLPPTKKTKPTPDPTDVLTGLRSARKIVADAIKAERAPTDEETKEKVAFDEDWVLWSRSISGDAA